MSHPSMVCHIATEVPVDSGKFYMVTIPMSWIERADEDSVGPKEGSESDLVPPPLPWKIGQLVQVPLRSISIPGIRTMLELGAYMREHNGIDEKYMATEVGYGEIVGNDPSFPRGLTIKVDGVAQLFPPSEVKVLQDNPSA